jgi:hypothetical protein
MSREPTIERVRPEPVSDRDLCDALAVFEKQALSAHDLDDFVNFEKENEAKEINIDGPEHQLRYLLGRLGRDEMQHRLNEFGR